MQTKPFFVEPEKDGCRRCGSGKSWNVIGPDDVALSTTFDDEDDAVHHAEILTEAYSAGYRKGACGDLAADETPRETLDVLIEDGWPLRSIPGRGIVAIATAREAQIAQGYDAAHDDAIEADRLAKAALHILYDTVGEFMGTPDWAYAYSLKHRSDRPRMLATAGALIAAEIDRLKRAEAKAPASETIADQAETNTPPAETIAPPVETMADDLTSAHPSGVDPDAAAGYGVVTCGALGGPDRFICTKPVGHNGDHIAHGEFEALRRWPGLPCDCIASGNHDKPKQHGADPHAKNCRVYTDVTEQAAAPTVADEVMF